MLSDGRRLGAHVPLAGGMVKAVERASAIGAETIQIFADNPSAWRRRAEPPAELPAFRERLAAREIAPVAIHAPYLVNLGGVDAEFFERSIAVLIDELRRAPSFGASFVNVHTGSHRGTSPEEGMTRIAEGVHRVMAAVESGPHAAQLVLENSAGSGFGVGVSVEELARIAEQIARHGVPDDRVAFCLDTAHLWAAGHDLSDPAVTDELLATFDRELGIDRLVMIHLNDAKMSLGSRLDRHEHIGAGGIGERGMAHILTHPLLAGKPYYLETPGMDEGYDAINLERARALAEGRPLAPLPPGAHAVKSSSRSRTGPKPERAGR